MAESDHDLSSQWPATEPAPGFVDRVMARLDAEQRAAPPPAPRPSRPRAAALAAAAALGAAAAVLVLWLWPRGASPEAGAGLVGSHLPSPARATLHVGARAVAVAEPQATLSWQALPHGAGQVLQQGGSVFYRVESSAAPFVVRTPHGQIHVVGTCFTIDVRARETRVWIHEGVVRAEVYGAVSGAQLTAGERVVLGPRGLEREAAPQVTSVRQAAAVAVAAPDAAQSDAPKIGHDRATLLEWAKRCRLRSDLPPFEQDRPKDAAAWVDYAQRLGATEAEAAALAEAFAEVEHDAVEATRELYVQTLGERDDLDALSLDRMLYDISRTADYHDQFEILARLSAERAGLGAAPARDQMSPLEVLMRTITTQGDRFEDAIARRLGAARAKVLRERNRGWPGTAVEWEGCPPGRAPR